MHRNQIELNPIISMDLLNPAVKKLADLFEKGFQVVYIYGTPGTGKSLAIELLIDEYDLAIIKIDKKIENIKQVVALSRAKSLLDPRKTVVIVDGIDEHSRQELELLAKGDWRFNQLILVGEKYPRASNPIIPFSKNKKYSFKKIKFDKLPERDMSLLISKVATTYKKPMLKADIDKIVNAVDGDIRKALSVTKNYFLGGGVDLEAFLPYNEVTQFNRVKRMFNGNYEDALEEVENFGYYYSVMIMAANIEGKKDSGKLLELLMDLSKSKVQDRERLLAILACKIHKKYSRGKYTKWIFPKRTKKVEKILVDAKCSQIKKRLYFI